MILGTPQINALRLGSVNVASARLGSIEVWSGIHPAAKSYAETTGLDLDSPQIVGLNGFLKKAASVGVELSWLVLGRSEFLSRSDGTYRSVIGPNGTVSGTVVDAETGMVLDGSSRVDFANPLKSPALDNLYVLCHAGSDEETLADSAKTLVSAYAGTSDRGPDLGYVSAAGLGNASNTVAMSISPDNSTSVPRSSIFEQHVPGVKKLSGLIFSGTNPGILSVPRPTEATSTRTSRIAKDLWTLVPTNSATTIYNDGITWSIGARPGGSTPLTGAIDAVLAGSHPLSEAQRDVIHGALLKHGLITTIKPVMLIGVGDSMTNGQTGSVPLTSTRTAWLTSLTDSYWTGSIYTNIALSGQPISIQEEMYAQAIARFSRFPDLVEKWVMFWGGYNIAALDWETEITRDAILQRYLDMAEDAAQRGISSVHWSKLMAGSVATVAEHADWNDKYEAGLQVLAALYPAVEFVWYDHRLTFNANEFDGAGRDPDFFVDVRHLSALGQQTLSKDFVARYPGPGLSWDVDAANYIARIIQKGVNPTTAQRQTINAWYLAEKAAGTYSDLKLVYLPIWDNAEANRVNLITGAMDATIVDDVIHEPGSVRSDMSGTPGYFALGESPQTIGMSTLSGAPSCYYAALLLEPLGVSQSAIGARLGGSEGNWLGHNSLSYPLIINGAVNVTKSSAGVAGILSGSHLNAELFVAERTQATRTRTLSAVGGSGFVTNLEIFALGRNQAGVASNLHGKPCGFWVAGLGKEDLEDERFTLGMKNLWEGVTGLTIP